MNLNIFKKIDLFWVESIIGLLTLFSGNIILWILYLISIFLMLINKDYPSIGKIICSIHFIIYTLFFYLLKIDISGASSSKMMILFIFIIMISVITSSTIGYLFGIRDKRQIKLFIPLMIKFLFASVFFKSRIIDSMSDNMGSWMVWIFIFSLLIMVVEFFLLQFLFKKDYDVKKIKLFSYIIIYNILSYIFLISIGIKLNG